MARKKIFWWRSQRQAARLGTNESAEATNAAGTHRIPPVNLLAVSIPVQYQITNLAAWAYINGDPDQSLLQRHRDGAKWCIIWPASTWTILMSRGRHAAEESLLRSSIQAQVDDRQLGVRIIFVGLEDIHPPTKVAKKFEEVIGAAETREAKILQAQAYSTISNAWASAEASNRLNLAEAERFREITNAAARAMPLCQSVAGLRRRAGCGWRLRTARLSSRRWSTGSRRPANTSSRPPTPRIFSFIIWRTRFVRICWINFLSSSEKSNMKRSPLTLAVAFVLIVIFGLMLFVYQVRKSEVAVVTFFGKIDHVKDTPGPGFQLPWPIEKVYKLDQRIQNFEGKFEESKLADQNIIYAAGLCRLAH